MRHTMLLVAVVVLCALGPPSWAYYNPFEGYGGQDVTMKLMNYDVGTQYFKLTPGKNYSQTELDALPIKNSYDPSATGPYKILPVGSPVPTGGSTASIEDSWGIVRLSDIRLTATNEQIWNAATSGWEITGIFYHEKDAEVRQSGSTIINNTVFGNGLYAVFFAEPIYDNPLKTTAEDFSAWTTDPNARAFEKGVDLGATARQGYNANPLLSNPLPEMQGATESLNSAGWQKTGGTSDPVPLWTFQTVLGDPFAYSVPPSEGGQGTGNQYEYYSTYSTNANGTMISGTGGAWAATHTDPYWGAGARNDVWQSNPDNTDPPHAVKLSFTMSPTNKPWLISSEDPINGTITPELSSASLMLIGLFPLGLVAWKRRKQ